MDHIISMFIDNELGLDDKKDFVERVHVDPSFKEQTLFLLEQEKLLRSEVVVRSPRLRLKPKRLFAYSLWRPMALLGSALAVALILSFFFMPFETKRPQTPYRFVIYKPDISRAEIAGSFTQWRKLPMERSGDAGYWEITLNLPKGEHRFIYILEGLERFPDPTLRGREKDDFGGENSIISI